MLNYENQPSKMKLFKCQGILFSVILILRIDVKMNKRMITKNNGGVLEKGLAAKSIL